jgi:hypothetical protein
MSTFNYNGLSLHLVRSRMEWRPERDKLCGADVIWNAYHLHVHGIVSTGDGVLPTDSGATLASVKHLLTAPRRPLQYSVNAHTLVAWEPTAPDPGLGPEPVRVGVQQLNDGAFFVDAEYIVRLRDCDANPSTSAVVSLRWGQSELFDELWNSIITTRGKLTVRADFLKSADSFRRLCVPPVLSDYRRVSSRYNLSPTGTELDFEFVDKEVDRLPPFPAVRASGTCTVNLLSPGVCRMGQVDLTLEGPKGTSRALLFTRAFSMAYAKLQAEGFLTDAMPIESGTFREDLFEPKVTVSLQARLTNFVAPGGPAVFRSVGKMPGLADGLPGLSAPVRKRFAGLVAQAFADPCAASYARLATTDEGGGSVFGSAPGAGTGSGGFVLTQGNSPPTAAGQGDTAPYDRYEIRSEYTYDLGARPLPGTGVGANGHRATTVTVHGGMMTLEVTWVAMRSGGAPILPSFKSPDPNLVPINSPKLITKQINPTADGALPTFCVAGHYVYLVIDPKVVSILAPIPPFLMGSAEYAKQAASFTSDRVLWSFVGASGPNPFFDSPTGAAPPQNAVPPVNPAVQPPASAGSGGTGIMPQPPVNP